MKLMYKINIVAILIMIGVALAITMAGMKTISQVTYDLNHEVMSREVDNVVSIFQNAYAVLQDNRLEGVESYNHQAQSDVLAELNQYRYRNSGELIIVDSSKKVVKHKTLSKGQMVDIDQVSSMFLKINGVSEFYYDGQRRFFNYKVFPQWDWLVILSVSSEEMLAPRSQFLGKVIIIILICLPLAGLIFIWFIGRIVSPIRQLADATTYVSEGEWNTPLPQPQGSDEVGQLAAAFGLMAQKLEEMYRNLQTNLNRIEQSQSDLRESEEKYRVLVELLPLVVFETDRLGNFVFANKFASVTFGYDKNDWSNTVTLQNLVTDVDQEKLSTNIRRILKGKDLGMMEYTGQRKDSTTFPCIALATPIYHHNKSCGLRGIFIDITDRKTLENKLRQAQEYLETILNNVADPIFVKNEEHQFVLCNDALCDFMGHKRRQIIGKTEYDFFTMEEADALTKEENLVFSSKIPREKEITLTGEDGNERIILTKKATFKDTNNKRVLVGIIKDITNRKKMEQELFKSDKLKSVGVLAGGIAHDFNNILTAVIGNLSLAKMLATPDSKIHNHITASESASIRAKDLTQQLLTFSRGGAPVKQTVSLTHLIEELATFTVRGSKVRCDLDLAPDLWPVDVDEGQISRVIHNLVMNGAQAMPNGGRIKISAWNQTMEASNQLPLKKGRYVHISIKDTGIGISPEQLPNIFDPYFTTKEDGSGLGLATAFSIINRHDGHIGVESTPNIGTTFTLYLAASGQKVLKKNTENSQLHRGHNKILIMDDEEIVRDTIGAMLTALGYSFELAEDGNVAIEKYKKAYESEQPFDLVIMDLTVSGGMGGQEAIKQLLAFDSSAKAIVSSGYSKGPVMSNFNSYGFVGVITKPFEIEKLSSMLHLALAENIAQKET